VDDRRIISVLIASLASHSLIPLFGGVPQIHSTFLYIEEASYVVDIPLLEYFLLSHSIIVVPIIVVQEEVVLNQPPTGQGSNSISKGREFDSIRNLKSRQIRSLKEVS
jgi:hypothetical protein